MHVTALAFAATAGGFLLVLAIVLPVAGILLSLVLGGRHAERIALVLMPAGVGVAIAIAVLLWRSGKPLLYGLGALPPPLGIALRADGFSAVMLVTAAMVISAAGFFARANFRTPQGVTEARAPLAFWILLQAVWAALNLNPAVGVGRAADFCDFSTKSCCVSRVRGVAASATDGPEGKLGRLSRGFAASVAGPSTALDFLPARAKKWRQRETPSRPEAPSHVNSLR